MRLMRVLLTAVNIIRGVRACVCMRAVIHAHTSAPPCAVSHASRTLNSRDTRTTCAALDEPKQTSATARAGQGDEEEGQGEARQGGQARWRRGEMHRQQTRLHMH